MLPINNAAAFSEKMRPGSPSQGHRFSYNSPALKNKGGALFTSRKQHGIVDISLGSRVIENNLFIIEMIAMCLRISTTEPMGSVFQAHHQQVLLSLI